MQDWAAFIDIKLQATTSSHIDRSEAKGLACRSRQCRSAIEEAQSNHTSRHSWTVATGAMPRQLDSHHKSIVVHQVRGRK